MIRIAVMVSGSGTNLQALIDNCRSGFIPGEIVLVISNKPDSYALQRAGDIGIDTRVIEKKIFPDEEQFNEKILEELNSKSIDLICLAGYLLKVGVNIIRAYKNRILNIHPALLPKFGGKGMYGIHVHEAVIENSEKISGCTVHFVDEEYDRGPTILQETVPVEEGDTPEILAERILKQEHILYPLAVRKFALGELETYNNKSG